MLKLEPKTVQAYYKRLRQDAEQCLKNHKITETGSNYWIIGEPGTLIFKAQILISYDRSLIVYGDIRPVIFSRFCGGPGNDLVVRWIATSGLHYIAEKAHIGMGYEGCEVYEPSVALDAALAYKKEAHEDTDDDRLRAWEEIIEEIPCEDADEIRKRVYEATQDFEIAAAIGMVPSPRVIWGWLMIQKLHQLLESEKENAES